MSKPIAFKKSRDSGNQPSIEHKTIEENFIKEVENFPSKLESQNNAKTGKVTTVPLTEEATLILEKLSLLEERSERKIASRLLCAALKAEWDKVK